MVDETDTDTSDEQIYELLPPEGDPEVGTRLFGLVADTITRKKDLNLPTTWTRNYQLRKGQHWKNNSASRPLNTANLIGTFVTRTANNLTSNNPTFDVTMGGPDDDPKNRQAYDDVHKTAQHWWTQTEQQALFRRSVIKGETYGIAITKMAFNPDLNMGMGDVETIIVDPFCFGWYPMDSISDPLDLQKTEANLFYRPMTVREAQRRWPKFADQFKSDEEYFKDLGEERREPGSQANNAGASGASTLISILNTIKQLGQSVFSGSGGKEPMLLVAEGWVHDYTMVTDTQENDLPNVLTERVQVTKPKYPGYIRYIVATNAGKIVMEDRPNPNINWEILTPEQQQMCYLYDKFPFCAVNSILDDESAWGWSAVEQLESIQMEYDKTLSQITLVKDRAARSKLINPKTSGVQNDEFTNDPGILNPTSAQESEGIKYLAYPEMAIDLYKAEELWKQTFFTLAGSFDLDQAQSPGRDVVAYKAIAALLENASTLIKDKFENYSCLIRLQGRMFVSLAQNFFTEDRWITARNALGHKQVRKVNGLQMLVPAVLEVVSGSTMPVSKVQQREEALELFKERAIDRIELLTKMGYDNATEIDMRMNQGAVGQTLGYLQQMGVPPQILQLIQKISGMKPNDFEHALRDGQIPTAAQIMQMINGQEPAGPVLSPEAQANAAKAQAEAQLLAEKTKTEQVTQQRIAAGIALDGEALKLKRAQTVAEMMQNQDVQNLQGVQAGHEAALKQGQAESDTRRADAETAANIALNQRRTTADIEQGHHAALMNEAKTVAGIHKGHHETLIKGAQAAETIRQGQVNGLQSDNEKE